MKTNQKMIFKLITLIAVIFFSMSTAFAQLGAVDIAMRGFNNNTNTINQIQVQVEKHKLHAIIFVNEAGEKSEKTIRLDSNSSQVNFTLPSGIYKIFIVELETGFTKNFTANLQ